MASPPALTPPRWTSADVDQRTSPGPITRVVDRPRRNRHGWAQADSFRPLTTAGGRRARIPKLGVAFLGEALREHQGLRSEMRLLSSGAEASPSGTNNSNGWCVRYWIRRERLSIWIFSRAFRRTPL